MSYLVLRELDSDLTQNIILQKNVLINSVRIYLYKHLSPTGTFKCSVFKGAIELAYGTLTSLQMESLSNGVVTVTNFAHGNFKFQLNRFLNLRKGNYTIKLTSTGYTFSESAYIGWIQAHENIRYNISGTVINSFDNPLTLELWRSENAKNS